MKINMSRKMTKRTMQRTLQRILNSLSKMEAGLWRSWRGHRKSLERQSWVACSKDLLEVISRGVVLCNGRPARLPKSTSWGKTKSWGCANWEICSQMAPWKSKRGFGSPMKTRSLQDLKHPWRLNTDNVEVFKLMAKGFHYMSPVMFFLMSIFQLGCWGYHDPIFEMVNFN